MQNMQKDRSGQSSHKRVSSSGICCLVRIDRYRSFGDVCTGTFHLASLPSPAQRHLTQCCPRSRPPYLRIRSPVPTTPVGRKSERGVWGYLQGPAAVLQVGKLEDLLVYHLDSYQRKKTKKNISQIPPPVTPSPSLLPGLESYICVFFKPVERPCLSTVAKKKKEKNTSEKILPIGTVENLVLALNPSLSPGSLQSLTPPSCIPSYPIL